MGQKPLLEPIQLTGLSIGFLANAVGIPGCAIVVKGCRNEKRCRLFTLSSVVKAAKKYAMNPSIRDEVFINKLLEPYVIASNARGRNDEEFYLDKHRTSKVLNGAVDVPLALRKVDQQHGLEERMLDECAVLFDETIDPELASYLMKDIIGLLTADNPKEALLLKKLQARIEERDSFLACAIIGAIGMNNKTDSENILWKRGSASLCWRIGDLFRFGFNNRKKTKNLVVIPVDCTFKTHVTREYESTPIKEVSEKSIHGQWLTRMTMSGINEKELSERIERELTTTGAQLNKSTDAYNPGTVVTIETSNAAYLLLAVSKFDSQGVARSTPEDVQASLLALTQHIIEKGQGADTYLPLIGTGLSKSGISCEHSYSLIMQTISDSASILSNKTTIVIQEKDVSDISLIN